MTPCRSALRGAALAEREEQIVEDRQLFGGERRRPGAEGTDGEVRGAAHGGPALAPAEPARRSRGQHERERTSDRGAVLGGDPLGERDEVHGNAELERAQRLQQALLGDLAVLGHAHDDPEDLAAPERHDQHRADVDALAQTLGQAVVERPAQRAGSRHRLNLGNGRHEKGRGPQSDPSGSRR